MRAAGSAAVMNQRSEALDSLDDFPTPPFGTRALVEIVFRKLGLYCGPGTLKGARVWEPAAGRCIMSEVLREYEMDVHTSDVHRYPDARARIDRAGSFIGGDGLGLDVLGPPNFRHSSRGAGIDFIITNPPFRLALEFALRARHQAEIVALLCRSNWAEGGERYERLFGPHPPTAIAQFCERVPMVAGGCIWREEIDEHGKKQKVRVPLDVGGYDPDASSATAYSWFIWMRGASTPTQFIFIPPGQADALSRPDDPARFAKIIPPELI